MAVTSTSVAQKPSRVIRGDTLVSSDLPSLRIVVAPTFRFVGIVPFQIRDVASGERFVFVEARDREVQRLIIAQFEAIRPGSSERYNYSFAQAPVIAGHRFRANAFAFSHAAARAQNPTGEAALTAAFLAGKGYRLDDEYMTIRYVTVPDRARRHELILFYLEPLKRASLRLADLNDPAGNATTAWNAAATALRARADSAFALAPLRLPTG